MNFCFQIKAVYVKCTVCRAFDIPDIHALCFYHIFVAIMKSDFTNPHAKK